MIVSKHLIYREIHKDTDQAEQTGLLGEGGLIETGSKTNKQKECVFLTLTHVNKTKVLSWKWGRYGTFKNDYLD